MGKVALVTGANRGLGLEVARSLAARGWTVAAGVRQASRLPPVPGVTAVVMDLATPAGLADLPGALRDRFGRVDLLVNNAAVLMEAEDRDLLDLDPQVLRTTLEVNLLGTLRVVQAVAPLMGSGGRIVNVSSGGGQLSAPSTWSPAYCLSKTSLNGLTVQLAEALKPKGIAVNAVCPGWVHTDMGGPSAPRSVEEGAGGILWLCLEAGQELTGGFFRDGKAIPW
jgi:NAD(P)-dependent dehydrogenase (short-subunit alcohol dehydrogenase family)